MKVRPSYIVGSAALAAGLWFLTSAVAAPPLPAETYKKAAEADIAQLQKHLAMCQAGAADAKRCAPTAKTLAMLLARYGEASGDAKLRDAALKVAEDIGKKDYKAAAMGAKDLAIKTGGKALPAAGLQGKAGFNLEEAMSAFRNNKVGGLNIERDIRDILKGNIPVNANDVGVLAARATVISEYATHYPNGNATINPANKAKWAKYSEDLIDSGNKLAVEANKGKDANPKEITKLLKSLEAQCSECHNAFRN